MSGKVAEAAVLKRVRTLRRQPFWTLLETAAAEAGGQLHLVGGLLRDWLLGHEAPDIDLLWDSDPERLATALRRHGAEVRLRPAYRSLQARIQGVKLDITAIRSDRYPVPGGIPVIEAAANVETDLARRDFTANAVALALRPDADPRWIDPFDGRADIAAGLLRPLTEQTLSEDPARLLRGIRYLGRYGWQPTGSWEPGLAMGRQPATWTKVAPGRLWAEAVRISLELDPGDIWRRMADQDLLAALFNGPMPRPWPAACRQRRQAVDLPQSPEDQAWLADLLLLEHFAPERVAGLNAHWQIRPDEWNRWLRWQRRVRQAPAGSELDRLHVWVEAHAG